MQFKYKDDAVRSEYEVTYLDSNDNKVFAYVKAYSEKQAQFYVQKKRQDCYRILHIEKTRELPDTNGKQLEMDFGE